MNNSNRSTDAGRARAARNVVASVRMSDLEHSALTAAAAKAGVPVAELARVLIRFGLAELKRGNGDLDRAIKTSRDAKRPGAVGPRT